MQFSNYYPGNDFLDILALDVYGSDFNQNYYDSLVVLSKGKPMMFFPNNPDGATGLSGLGWPEVHPENNTKY